ncbi:MAG: hypothetical protein NXI32_05030 [bacterium]|nr:hypothetical protein [bacterium]
MLRKITINEFKKAIRQDGNLKWIDCPRAYVTRQIDRCRLDGQLTTTQADKLYDWAHDKFAL